MGDKLVGAVILIALWLGWAAIYNLAPSFQGLQIIITISMVGFLLRGNGANKGA